MYYEIYSLPEAGIQTELVIAKFLFRHNAESFLKHLQNIGVKNHFMREVSGEM